MTHPAPGRMSPSGPAPITVPLHPYCNAEGMKTMHTQQADPCAGCGSRGLPAAPWFSRPRIQHATHCTMSSLVYSVHRADGWTCSSALQAVSLVLPWTLSRAEVMPGSASSSMDSSHTQRCSHLCQLTSARGVNPGWCPRVDTRAMPGEQLQQRDLRRMLSLQSNWTRCVSVWSTENTTAATQQQAWWAGIAAAQHRVPYWGHMRSCYAT